MAGGHASVTDGVVCRCRARLRRPTHASTSSDHEPPNPTACIDGFPPGNPIDTPLRHADAAANSGVITYSGLFRGSCPQVTERGEPVSPRSPRGGPVPGTPGTSPPRPP